MDTTDILDSQSKVGFDERALKAVLSAGKWAQILAICCLIMGGIYFLWFVFVIFQTYQQMAYFSYPGAESYIWVLLLLSGIGAVLTTAFVISFVTYNKFGSRAKKSVQQGRQDYIILGFKSLNTVFLYQSILLIISVALGILSFGFNMIK